MEPALPEIRNVTGTAFVVAEFRAEENGADMPLYCDHVVDLFLDEHSRRAARRLAAQFPAVKQMVQVRTKYFDDMLERQLLSRFRQVVILGAGLDTRAARKRAQGVTYFEIDSEATLELKQARYAQRRLDVDARFIPGDYVADGLVSLLRANGFDFDAPTYVIWEGNTMYLPLDTVRETIAELRLSIRRLRLSFDYMAEAVIANTTGDPGISALVDSFARMGAPWVSGIRDVRQLADEMCLTVVDNFTTSELHRTYWFERPITSPIFDYYSVCTLGT